MRLLPARPEPSECDDMTMKDDLDPKFWGPPPSRWDRFLNRLYHGWKRRVKPPWWFCCGWWSPWCVIDTIAHDWFGLSLPVEDDSDHWVCQKHTAAVERHLTLRKRELSDG